jgi:hypothetical protein
VESQFIDGHEFILDARREKQEAHQCVCLLVHGTEADVAIGLGREDKCTRMVDSPDQAFCNPCEEAEHHLASNQFGEARNIHRKGKNT